MSELAGGRPGPGSDSDTSGRHVFLFGQKHAGKSTLGRIVAGRLGLTFLDLDDLIVELANLDHAPPAEDARAVYYRHGADGFRGFEAEAASRLAERLAWAPRTVCALGGGTVQNDSAYRALEAQGLFVYLYVDTDELYRRVCRTGRPAFLTSEDPADEFRRLAAERDDTYRRRADLVCDLDALGRDAAADTLERYLRENGIGRQ
ncbi:MAG: shikimate kinase [Spirochaetaceae bacterium]